MLGCSFSCNFEDKSDIIMTENLEELKDPMLCKRFDKNVDLQLKSEEIDIPIS